MTADTTGFRTFVPRYEDMVALTEEDLEKMGITAKGAR